MELVSEDIPFTFGRHVHIENIILVAKLKNEVIGFIFCHFYPHRRKAMVSYFGINKNRRCACQKASEKLLEQLRNILFTDDRCDFLFFDLQGVEPSLPSKEQAHRKSRITLFKQRAKEQGLEAYQFIFNYKCPKIYTDRYEHPFVLMCVPIKGSLPLRVPKKNND